MPRLRTTLAGALLASVLAAPAAFGSDDLQPVAPAAPPTPPTTVLSKDRVIVQWAAAADRLDRVEARQEAEVNFATDLGNRTFQLVEVESGQTAGAAAEELEENPAVAVAEPDGYRTVHALPNDPLLGQLWGLQNLGLGVGGVGSALAGSDIDAPGAWIRTIGSPSTVVAVIDSGYRFEHPDLASVAWTNPGETANGLDDDGNGIADDLHGADFVGNNGEAPTTDGNPADEDLVSGGHGVHTAGTIGAAGNNGVGITGVAQNARIMPLRVCSRFPVSGKNRCPFSSILAAIIYAGQKGAKVANMSLGGNTFTQTEVNAIAAAKNTLFVISAGNDGGNNDGGEAAPKGHHYPCDYRPTVDALPPVSGAIDNIICVAATDQADGLASFSDWGATSVDLGAPGTETLSAYPFRVPFLDDFQTNDFGTRWAASGASGGFSRANESPLTSFGMTDSPGSTPIASQARASTSAAVTLPAGFTACRVLLTGRVLRGSGGVFGVEALRNGSFASGGTFGDLTLGRYFIDLGAALAGGGAIQVRFSYTAGSAPTSANGAWFDDIELLCGEPVGQAQGYAFLQGTSMAAPHVSGAAALLFSLKPSATVAQVRSALLSSVDPVPSLAGKTVTGGRLDASEAVDLFDTLAPLAPVLATDPPSGSSNELPRIVGAAEERSTVVVYQDAGCVGLPLATITAATLAAPGVAGFVPHGSTRQFSAKATDTALNTSPCSAPISYTSTAPIFEDEGEFDAAPSSPSPSPASPLCKVPALAGMTLASAKSALAAAHCTLGKVTKPKAKKGKKLPLLVVKSSTPAAGASPASGTVDLKLGPKPKPKKKRH